MSINAEGLRAAFESRELDQLVALLDERVVWRGLPGIDYGRDAGSGTVAEGHHDEHYDEGGHEEDGHDHEHVALCTNREEVGVILEGFLAAGSTGQPVILAEAGDSLVIDPRRNRRCRSRCIRGSHSGLVASCSSRTIRIERQHSRT